MGVLKAAPPKYSVILELDRRIRDMPLPKYAQGPRPQNAGMAQMMSHYMPTNYLHFSQLHSFHPSFMSRRTDTTMRVKPCSTSIGSSSLPL